MELLCSLKSLWMEKLDKELHNGPESQGSSWLLSMVPALETHQQDAAKAQH